jgi:hypothetical protein
MANLSAQRKPGHCAIARRLIAATLVAAAPFVDSYAGGLQLARSAENNSPIVIYLPPRMKGNESVEDIIKRMNSERIVIILPSEYVAQNRVAVDSMVKAADDANQAIKRLISKPERRHYETAICSAPQSAEEQIRTWYERRHEAFGLMASVFPKELENDCNTRKDEISIEPPSDVRLGVYHDYMEKSIGIACVFFYKESWKEKADDVVANIDWTKVRSNINVMLAMRDGKNAGSKVARRIAASIEGKTVRKNLSDQYLSMVAVLADVMEQLTGVDRNTQLAIGTQETRMDHDYFNREIRDRGIMQLNRNNPLFTCVAYDSPRNGAKEELESVMDAILPEKRDFGLAKTMMAGLFNAVDIRGDQQGDITMNMIAGALTYRYKYYQNNGRGRLSYSVFAVPSVISFDRKSVEDYNGAEHKGQYAVAVEKYWSQFRRAIRAAV